MIQVTTGTALGFVTIVALIGPGLFALGRLWGRVGHIETDLCATREDIKGDLMEIKEQIRDLQRVVRNGNGP